MVLPTVQTGSLSHKIAHRAPINVVVYNSTGQYVLSGGNNRVIDLWNPSTGNHVRQFTGHGYEVLDLHVSDDSSRFVSCGGDRAVFLWDVTAGRTVRRFHGHSHRVNTVHFNQDASVIASGSYDATVKLWDCRSQASVPIQTLEESHDSITSIDVHLHTIITGSADGHVRSYDLRKGMLHSDTMPAPVSSVQSSSDGRCILVSSLDSHLRLIDTTNGGLLQVFQGHLNTQYRSRACFAQNESYILQGSEDGRVCAWDMMNAKLVYSFPDHKNHIVTCTASNPVRDEFISSGTDGTITIYQSK